MPLSWIVKTIPRSPRALFMLVVVLGSLGILFLGLRNLFVPNDGVSQQTIALIVVGSVSVVLSATIFYYFQAADDRKRHHLD